ncbi:putative secreted protein with PEP-CTERM sorting signal [Prosthecobacter fusiformis]|uniref:Putative secreted protein with PEP-CTERM sorting signal n=1 Tax=Prosthecobacter fusiformis TaxID=48464 RepID=A0A4R7S6V6_9BACT|nr:autotransporter-associated beta strand repeat-containing protein [Prosthecobacter fusiformis]TDU73185.1 putative secreted protein with PEP-CTERM sorting signal [Prosthecobacter fusiformis]
MKQKNYVRITTAVHHAALSLLLLTQVPLFAQTSVYWDINGVTAGAGGTAPAGEWNTTNTYWNSLSTGGNGTLSAWSAGNVAVFSAGTDATGSYTVGVTGTHDIQGLTFEEGTVVLKGGTLNLTALSILNVATSRTATLEDLTLTGNFGLTKRGRGTLKLIGTTQGTFLGDFRMDAGLVQLETSLGSALGAGNIIIEAVGGTNGNANLTTLQLMDSDQINDASTVTLISRQYNASLFDLNGYSETIGGLTITALTGTNNIGVMTGANGVLTVNGDIFLNNNRGGMTGNNVRDVLISGTGNRSTAAANSGYLDLGGGVRTITVQSAAATLYGNDDATIETIIQNGGIIKAGNQMLILAGTNTYTGGTTINAGTLRLGGGILGAGTATGSILGNVLNNGILEFNRTNAYTFTGDITGTGAVTKLSTGTLTLTGNNSYSGLTTVTNGSLQVEKFGMAGSATGTNVGTHARIDLGSTTTNIGLIYAGAGETTDKVLRFTGTTGTFTLSASGSGAVVFQNAIEFNTAGNKTFTLAGTSTAANTLQGGIPDSTGGGITSLLKTEAGTWVLGGSNTYTGTTTIRGGTLRLTGSSVIPQTGITVSNGVFDIAGMQDLTLNGDPSLMLLPATEDISYALFLGGGSSGSSATVSLATGRTLNLNSHLAYSSTNNNLGANISGGTLNLGSGQRIFVINDSTNAASDLTVSSTIISNADGILMKSGPGRMTLTTGLSVGTVRVNMGRLDFAGATNIIAKSLQVGYNNVSIANYATTGGQMTVGSGVADTLDVGITLNAQAYSYAGPNGILDLRGSDSFTANVGTVRVGVHTSVSGASFSEYPEAFNGVAYTGSLASTGGALYLPVNSSITARTSFSIADAGGGGVSSTVDTNLVQFGEGVSTVKTSIMYVGYRKGSGTVTIRDGGVLTLQGVADGARSSLYVGYNAINTAVSTVSRMDLANGTFIADLSSLTIGYKNGVTTAIGTSTGQLTLGSGSNDVDVSGKVTIGYLEGTSTSISSFGQGTLSMAGGTFTVGGNVELAILLATIENSPGTLNSNPNFASRGTLNLTGGTFTVNGNIVTTADSLNRNTATVNLNGGTLDMTGGSIGAADALITLNAQSGSLVGLAGYNGSAALVKTTSGVLTLGGTNTYGGSTLVQAGTLEILSGSSTGGGNTSVEGSGAILAGVGTVSASTTLTSGSIRPGANGGLEKGILTFAGNLTLNAAIGSGANITLGISAPTGLADLDAYAVSQIPSQYNFETYNSVAGNLGDHDLVLIQGTLTWNEGTKLIVEDLGVNYAYGQVFNLLDWTGLLSGGPVFSSDTTLGGEVNSYLQLPSLVGTGFYWDLTLFASHGLFVVVPEPGRAGLLLLSFCLFALRRRR